MTSGPHGKVQIGICTAGMVLLGCLFAQWYAAGGTRSFQELAAALLCLVLFAAVCLRFVPRWFAMWFGVQEPAHDEKGIPLPRLFLTGLLCGTAYIAAVELVLSYVNPGISIADRIGFWRAADSYHYLCIARDWYLSEGSIDRLVQLVFLPLYPIAVRVMHVLVKDYVIAGMLVSLLSYSGALCVFYRLVLFDYGRDTARCAAIILCLTPGAFFFFAPMSESLFILLCALCVYSLRRGKWLAAGIFGALAAFTRSLGLMLAVPVFFETVSALLHGEKRAWRGAAALLMIPLGFAAYCLINYQVSGDAFKFMEYQREHWNQRLGLFFGTAAYQTRYAIAAAGQGSSNLYGLWLPNLAAVFGTPVILFLGGRKMRASYTAWAIAYYFVAVGATWLLSAPRYMAALLPLHTALALAAEKKWQRAVLYSVMAIAGAYYLAVFVLRLNVW